MALQARVTVFLHDSNSYDTEISDTSTFPSSSSWARIDAQNDFDQKKNKKEIPALLSLFYLYYSWLGDAWLIVMLLGT